MSRGITTDSEPSAARQAYCDYRDMGPARSLKAILARYRSVPGTSPVPTKRWATLHNWSKLYNWGERCRLYDEHLWLEQEHNARQARLKDAEYLRAMRLETADVAARVALQRLQAMLDDAGKLRERITVRDALKLAEYSAQTQRLDTAPHGSTPGNGDIPGNDPYDELVLYVSQLAMRRSSTSTTPQLPTITSTATEDTSHTASLHTIDQTDLPPSDAL